MSVSCCSAQVKAFLENGGENDLCSKVAEKGASIEERQEEYMSVSTYASNRKVRMDTQ